MPISAKTKAKSYLVTRDDWNGLVKILLDIGVRLDIAEGIPKSVDLGLHVDSEQDPHKTGIEDHEADIANPHTVTFTQAVAADSGTDITAAEAEELTDGSETDLHSHAMINYLENGSYAGPGAGVVTLAQEVDLSKTMVNSWPTTSGGTVAATGTISGTVANTSGGGASLSDAGGPQPQTIAATISGGTTDLQAELYHAYFSASSGNSDQLNCTGPCRYQIIEFN